VCQQEEVRVPKRSKASVDGCTPDLVWHKSTASANNTTGCIEAALNHKSVLIRDTKNRTGPILAFPHDEWRTFLDWLH
jgi:hypothetical protein